MYRRPAHRRGETSGASTVADEPPSAVVRKVKTTSDYFNTLAKDAREPKLIQAIIDEDIKAVDGSRIRLRLLDDVENRRVRSETGVRTCTPR